MHFRNRIWHNTDRRGRRSVTVAIELRYSLFLAQEQLEDTFPVLLRQSVPRSIPVSILGTYTSFLLHFIYTVPQHTLELRPICHQPHVSGLGLACVSPLRLEELLEPLVHLNVSLQLHSRFTLTGSHSGHGAWA